MKVTREWISTLENMVNEITGYARYQVGKRYGYYAIDLYNNDGGCMTTLQAGMSSKECMLYLTGLLEGLTKGDI